MKRKIKRILKKVFKNKGGTFLIENNQLKEVKKGFVGGIKETEEIFPLETFYEKNVKDFLKKYLKKEKVIIGFWIYKNKIYINLCIVSSNKIKIENFCKKNNLIAYYDLNKKENIFI